MHYSHEVLFNRRVVEEIMTKNDSVFSPYKSLVENSLSLSFLMYKQLLPVLNLPRLFNASFQGSRPQTT